MTIIHATQRDLDRLKALLVLVLLLQAMTLFAVVLMFRDARRGGDLTAETVNFNPRVISVDEAAAMEDGQ